MILTIIFSLNVCITLIFYHFGTSIFSKFWTFTIILMISYFEISIFKKLIEKFTDVEFFNGYD